MPSALTVFPVGPAALATMVGAAVGATVVGATVAFDWVVLAFAGAFALGFTVLFLAAKADGALNPATRLTAKNPAMVLLAAVLNDRRRGSSRVGMDK